MLRCYCQSRRTGVLFRMTKHMTFPERLALIERGPDECWIWIWATLPSGYGHFRRNKLDEYAHRAAYELRVGPILGRRELDHTCENPPCCNPAHLVQSTHRTHMARHHTKTVACVRGHRLDVPRAWARFPHGKRGCRLCYEGWNAVRWNPEEAAAYRRLGREGLTERDTQV